MIFSGNLAFSLFVPQGNPVILGLYIAACLAVGALFLVGLVTMPRRFRRPVVIGLTFLTGLFYFTEFMFPGRDAAPVRDRLSASETHLRAAAQDVYALIVAPSSSRLAHANGSLGAAGTELAAVKSEAGRVQPRLEGRLNDAEVQADRWAKANRVPDRLLDRQEGKIIDLRTQAFSNRNEALQDAVTSADSAMKVIAESRTALTTVDKSKLPKIQAMLAGSADSIALSRSNLTDNFLTPYVQPVGDATLVLGSLLIGLGIISLTSVHGKAVARLRPGWYNSLAFFIAMISIAGFGFLQAYLPKSAVKSFSEPMYSILYVGALNAFSATMFSLVAFYIVSAAYRAFRVKSGESALMMVSAFIVMLGLVPIGVLITSKLDVTGWQSIFRLENIMHWILAFPNTAAQRGISFGIGVGGLAMSLRIWFSLERGSYFDKEM